MVDRRKKLHRQVTALAENLEVPMLETEVPYSSVIEQMGVRRAPVATFSAGSAAARAFGALWSEIRGK